jgi:hypothetical protein
VPTHVDSDSQIATSSPTLVANKPVGLADGMTWYVAGGFRGSISVATPPAGFDEVANVATATTASGVRLAVYSRHFDGVTDPASGAPASVTIEGSGNVFGAVFSWAADGVDPAADVDAFLAAIDNTNDANVASPAVDATVGGTLVYRGVFMSNPAAGFALNDFATTDATRVESPAMPAGTNRVSGGLAHEAGPGSAGTTGTEGWTVAGTTWGAAYAWTLVVRGASFSVDAGPDENVVPGELVELDFNPTNPSATSFSLALTGGTYPSAHIINISDGVWRFIAPEGPATLEFTLTAGDGTLEGTDTMTVNVSAGSGGGLRIGILGADGQPVY